MSGDAWITVVVMVLTFGMLAWDRLAPSAVVLMAAVTLLITGVIDTAQALSGFANPAPITVAALYVLARAAEKTGMLSPLTARLLGKGQGRVDLARLAVPAAGASAFLNNTPLVAMMTPDIVSLTQRRGLAASRFLMPLSFAAILGGTMTVLGTSTNLVVSGLLAESGQAELGLFEVTPIGGPVALVGMVVLILVSWRLVPIRSTAQEQAQQEIREFVVTMEVMQGGSYDGVPINDTDLIGRRHVFLVQLTQGDRTMAPVDLDTVLQPGDRLTFVGEVTQIVGLYRLGGLRSTSQKHLDRVAEPGHSLFVAVVGRTSPLAGHQLADIAFLGRYQAAVLAIHRDGHRITADPREVRFRPGDALMVLAGPQFQTNWSERRDFLLISRLGGDPPTASRRAPVVAAITVIMVVVAALGILSILEAALLAAGALVATRVLTSNEVRDAIDFDVIILIAASFALGAAMATTGLATSLANVIIASFDQFGTVGVVFGLLLAMAIITELVTNNAAVIVVFPIAMSLAATTGLDSRTLAIAIGVVASCSFLTPIGYQTNTIVYGPGGYRFTDYARVGWPLTFTVLAMATAIVTSM